MLGCLLFITLSGCSGSDLACGEGTRQMGEACVPIATLGCGNGTTERNGECVPTDTLACGEGTRNAGGECVPINVTTCAEGTEEVDGQCVPTVLQGGNFSNPLVQLQELHGVGSHTDEVRLRHEDNLLFNCSYTFNIIDVSDAKDMDVLAEGLRHEVEGQVSRAPGCKHLAWEGDLVFTTHLGNIRNPAFLSGWDITDPEAPVQLPAMQEAGVSYESVDVANGNIFVALHAGGLGVYRFDTTTGTAAFARIGTLDSFTNAWGVDARGDTVFVTDLAEGLVTVDATDPTAPAEIGRVVVGGTARHVVVDGDYAYVAAGGAGAVIVDISNLANPTVVGRVEMPGNAVRLDYSEGRIFVAAWNDVRVYDVTTPSDPRFVAATRIRRPYDYDDPERELPTHRIFGVAARGTDVFVGAWEHPYSYRLFPDRQAPNIRLPESAARVDFGAVAVGESKTVELEVTNQGTAPLTLLDNWVSGAGFSVEPRQALIQPGETAELMVSLTPSGTGEVTGYLHIESDDPEYPLRKSYLAANSPGIVPGSELPLTTATLMDGTTWTSEDATGDVQLLFYFATF